MPNQDILPALPLEMSIAIFTEQVRHAIVSRRMFAELFESAPEEEERDRAMHKVAPYFFEWLNLALLDYTLLQAGKLLDPVSSPKNGQNRRNVSCAAIRERVPDAGVRQKLGALELEEFLPHIKEARDRLLAHADEETIATGEPVGGFPAEVGEKYYAGLQEFVNILHGGLHVLQDSMIINDVRNVLHKIRAPKISARMVSAGMNEDELNKRNGETEET